MICKGLDKLFESIIRKLEGRLLSFVISGLEVFNLPGYFTFCFFDAMFYCNLNILFAVLETYICFLNGADSSDRVC